MEGARRDHMMLRTNQVSFTYPATKNPALESVDLSVQRGERLGILGESGSGKSTLLSLLAGIHSPTSGEGILDNIRVTAVPPHDRRFTIVLQNPPPIRGTTVRELVFRLAARDRTRGEANIALERVLESLHILELADKKLTRLSGGQLQRA